MVSWCPFQIIKRFLTSNYIVSGSVNLTKCWELYNFSWHYSVILSQVSPDFKQPDEMFGKNSVSIYGQLRANQSSVFHHICKALLHNKTIFPGKMNLSNLQRSVVTLESHANSALLPLSETKGNVQIESRDCTLFLQHIVKTMNKTIQKKNLLQHNTTWQHASLEV